MSFWKPRGAEEATRRRCGPGARDLLRVVLLVHHPRRPFDFTFTLLLLHTAAILFFLFFAKKIRNPKMSLGPPNQLPRVRCYYGDAYLYVR